MNLDFSITYFLTCRDEPQIFPLIDYIRQHKDKNDKILILLDPSNHEYEHKLKAKAKVLIHKLDGDFSGHKNMVLKYLNTDYTFHLDSDEAPSIELIKNIKLIIANTNYADVITLPRVNNFADVTPEICLKYGWQKITHTQQGHTIINWPDAQNRIFRNGLGIRWEGKLHEALTCDNAIKIRSMAPFETTLAIIHTKQLKDHEKCHNFYQDFSLDEQIKANPSAVVFPRLELIKQVNHFNNYPVRVSLSCEYFDGLCGVIRNMDMVNNTSYNSTISLIKLDEDFNIVDDINLGRGEDAKLFSYNNKPYILNWIFNKQKHDLDMFLLDVSSGQSIKLINRDLNYTGKNWSVYEYDYELYFIHSLQPLIILKLIEPDQLVLYYSEIPIDKLNEFKFGSSNSEFKLRAASPAKLINGKIMLISRTGTPLKHMPFISIIDPMTFKSEHRKITGDWPYVADGCGLFRMKDTCTWYVSMVESPALWSKDTEWFKNSIYRLDFKI